MKNYILSLLLVTLIFSCSEDDNSTNTPPPPPEPITLATDWSRAYYSSAETGILDLTPYAKVDVSFQVDFNSDNTHRQEYYFVLSFPRYSTGILYGHSYQTTNSKTYNYSITIEKDFGFSTFYVSKADSVYFSMAFVIDDYEPFQPKTITYSNLKILGYKE